MGVSVIAPPIQTTAMRKILPRHTTKVPSNSTMEGKCPLSVLELPFSFTRMTTSRFRMGRGAMIKCHISHIRSQSVLYLSGAYGYRWEFADAVSDGGCCVDGLKNVRRYWANLRYIDEKWGSRWAAVGPHCPRVICNVAAYFYPGKFGVNVGIGCTGPIVLDSGSGSLMGPLK